MNGKIYLRNDITQRREIPENEQSRQLHLPNFLKPSKRNKNLNNVGFIYIYIYLIIMTGNGICLKCDE